MERALYEQMENCMLDAMEAGAHDAEHVYRVLYAALDIAQTEPAADLDVVIAACLLHDIGRAEYVAVTDGEAVDAFEYLSRTEGIIPAIESAHAVAHAIKLAPQMGRDQVIVINISGRGDKDCAAIARYRGEDIHE